MTNRILLGSHISIRGGLHTAFERGAKAGCTTMQVFTKNSNQWAAKPLTNEEIEHFRTTAAHSRITPVFAHASYLINLCAANSVILSKSRTAIVEELTRCEYLGIAGLVVHPGSHVGAGEAMGVRQIAESINTAHERTRGFRSLTLLETTAGQGSTIGYSFEQLRAIIDRVDQPERVAVCLDTCHVFAAGYNIGTEEGWKATMQMLDQTVGLERINLIHVNDSRKELGSRVDRHEHIGKGYIGLTGFRLLMNDSHFAGIPKILETEKSDDLHEDIENMILLRSLLV